MLVLRREWIEADIIAGRPLPQFVVGAYFWPHRSGYFPTASKDHVTAMLFLMQQWRWATENTMPDKVALGIFVATMIAFVICGCILTRKPRKGPNPESTRPPAASI
jgi:hypothetical protein